MEKAPSNGVSTQMLFAPKGFDVDIKLNMESREREEYSPFLITILLTVKFWKKEVESNPDPFLMWSSWGHNLILCHQPKTALGSMEWPKAPTGRHWGKAAGTMYLEPWGARMCDVPSVGFSFPWWRLKAFPSVWTHLTWGALQRVVNFAEKFLQAPHLSSWCPTSVLMQATDVFHIFIQT